MTHGHRLVWLRYFGCPVHMTRYSSDLAKSLAICRRPILSPKNWLRPQIGRARWGFNQTYPIFSSCWFGLSGDRCTSLCLYVLESKLKYFSIFAAKRPSMDLETTASSAGTDECIQATSEKCLQPVSVRASGGESPVVSVETLHAFDCTSLCELLLNQ